MGSKIVLFIFLLSSSLFSEIIHIENISDFNPSYTMYYEDTTSNLTFNQIKEKKFLPTQRIADFGYTTSTFWVKFTYAMNQKTINSSIRYLLVIERPLIEHVDIYYENDGKLYHKKSGKRFSLSDNQYPNKEPLFYLPHSKQQTIYIKLQSKDTIIFNPKIYQEQEFIKHDVDYHMFMGVYFGFLIIIIMYNLRLYITLKDKNYLWYLLFLLSLFFTSALNYNFLQDYIYRGDAWFNNHTHVVMYILTVMAATKMTQAFVRTDIYMPLIHNILTYIIIIGSILIVFTLYHDRPTLLVPIYYSLFPLLLTYYASFKVMLMGYEIAKYFFIAFMIFLLSSSSLPLMFFGLIPANFWTEHSHMFGTMIEAIILSFALSNKIKTINEEKERAQQRLLQQTQEINAQLEQKIQLRIRDIEQMNQELSSLLEDKELLLKEVFHRVKNNFQMMISILWLEANKSANSAHKDSFLSLINRMKSMALVHQYLYNSQTLSHIKTTEYIQNIVDEIKQIYWDRDVDIISNIDECDLNMENAMALGIIINEVLNNAIKHFNKDSLCKIVLSLKYQPDYKLIDVTIQDNGTGITMQQIDKSNGLGKKLIDQFCKKLDTASYHYEKDHGTLFKLTFSL